MYPDVQCAYVLEKPQEYNESEMTVKQKGERRGRGRKEMRPERRREEKVRGREEG